MSTEEAQKKYIYSSSVIHERTHTKKCPTLIRCQQKKRRKNAYVHQALRTRKKKLTALAPEFLENGQRDPYKNSGADGGPPVGHFASQDDFDPNSFLGAIRHKRPKMSSVQRK